MKNKLLDDHASVLAHCPNRMKCYSAISHSLNQSLDDLFQIRKSITEERNITILHKEKAVSEFLRYLGAPPSLLGYRFIISSILMIADNPDIINNVSRFLYPEIARSNNTTSSRVEKNIRVAIKKIIKMCEPDVLEKLFHQNRQPSNVEFLSTLAEHLRNNNFNWY